MSRECCGKGVWGIQGPGCDRKQNREFVRGFLSTNIIAFQCINKYDGWIVHVRSMVAFWIVSLFSSTFCLLIFQTHIHTAVPILQMKKLRLRTSHRGPVLELKCRVGTDRVVETEVVTQQPSLMSFNILYGLLKILFSSYNSFGKMEGIIIHTFLILGNLRFEKTSSEILT